MEYLFQDNLIFPGGNWYEHALNEAAYAEEPVQIYKDGDTTYLSAYLKGCGSDCEETIRGKSVNRKIHQVQQNSQDKTIKALNNTDGTFTLSDSRTPPRPERYF